MIDREKVIKGLELCNSGYDGFCDERECPYYQHGCPEGLRDDILALLKEQEAEIKEKNQRIWELLCERDGDDGK